MCERIIIGCGALAALCAPLGAEVIYETSGPFGGPFGLIGFDVSSTQSVAVRFTPDADSTLDRVSLWFMSNDFTGKTHPLVTVTLRTDDSSSGESIPGEEVIETWQFNVSAVGWDPMLEALDSREHPLLHAGEHYWVVAESEAPGGEDGVWNWAAMDSGFVSICNGDPCEWSPGNMGAVAATIVEGTPANAADLNGDGSVNAADLALLLGAWGECEVPPPGCPADLNQSDDVNAADLALLLGAWG